MMKVDSKPNLSDQPRINRFSSRRQRLDHAFLSAQLKEAKPYTRIAGYFRSSIFELVGEEIAAIASVRIVCKSELDVAATHANESCPRRVLRSKNLTQRRIPIYLRITEA